MHLEDVLADDMKIVEQPVSRRTNVNVVDGDRGESLMGILEDVAGFAEPSEEASAPSRHDSYPLSPGNGRDALGELLRTQQLTPDRTGKQWSRRPGG